MKNDEKRLIAQSFTIESLKQTDLGDFLYKIAEKYIYEVVDSWENFCIDSLYKEYQKHGFTKVFVINKEEFKKFLLWALPEYYRRFKNEK